MRGKWLGAGMGEIEIFLAVFKSHKSLAKFSPFRSRMDEISRAEQL